MTRLPTKKTTRRTLPPSGLVLARILNLGLSVGSRALKGAYRAALAAYRTAKAEAERYIERPNGCISTKKCLVDIRLSAFDMCAGSRRTRYSVSGKARNGSICTLRVRDKLQFESLSQTYKNDPTESPSVGSFFDSLTSPRCTRTTRRL